MKDEIKKEIEQRMAIQAVFTYFRLMVEIVNRNQKLPDNGAEFEWYMQGWEEYELIIKGVRADQPLVDAIVAEKMAERGY